MQSQLKLPVNVQNLFCCPACRTSLSLVSDQLVCNNTACNAHFPVVDGIPVLINELTSVFSIDDFVQHRKTTRAHRSRIKKLLVSALPKIGMNMKATRNYKEFAQMLLGQSARPRVLIIGGSIAGKGMKSFLDLPSLEIVESDVTFGPRTNLICDAHDLPFVNDFFDGVVVQVVLEHVADPFRCVEEIHRVLKKQGLVYAETPFMQQVHSAPYDFTRFTHLGHRRLFRRFEEIDSGPTGGPGMALAWSCYHFLLSFTTSKFIRKLIALFSMLTLFWLKYIDYYLINKPGAFDASSQYYFMGRKTDHVLPDKELIKLYRGAS